MTDPSNVASVSTESIVRPPHADGDPSSAGATGAASAVPAVPGATGASAMAASAAAAVVDSETCPSCAAPLAADQRYCLECGERRATMSSVLLGGPPLGDRDSADTAAPRVPPNPPGQAPAGAADGQGRGNLTAVIAGVGVLLIAMGVGVLIGRSGQPKSSPAPPPQVITVGSSTPATGSTGSTGEASSAAFTGDWPAGTSGYTVQLQTLPAATTQPSAVEAAKTSATAKGAKEVGALKSEEFSSLPTGDYVVYSGVDHTKPEAEKALSGLKKSFPAATVIHVASSSSSSGSGSSSSSSGRSSGSGAGANESHPAPPSTVQNLSKKHGQSYEQESKALPNVVSTG